MVFAMIAVAEEPTAEEVAVGIEYIGIPLDAEIKQDGNFSAELVINYSGDEKADDCLIRYTNRSCQYDSRGTVSPLTTLTSMA